jgi:hypothetical protein
MNGEHRCSASVAVTRISFSPMIVWLPCVQACIIALGTVSTVVFGGLQSWNDIREGHDVGFKSFC